MIGRALAFFAGLLVQRLLTIREDFEDRLEALEDEVEARVLHPPLCARCQERMCQAKAEGKLGIVHCGCATPRDADGRERSVSN